jgi:predicted O-methyltransferase YrrM
MDIFEVAKIAEMSRSTPDPRPIWLERMRETDSDQALYYRFLYELSKAIRPTWILETGTRLGLSAAQLAMGCPTAKVVTIDIDPNSKARFSSEESLKNLPNVIPITADSRKAKDLFPPGCDRFGIIYLDSDHTYDVVSPEFKLYREMLAPGGVMVFDDIALNPEMKRFWSEVPQPKIELNFLHRLCGAGFGAHVKA